MENFASFGENLVPLDAVIHRRNVLPGKFQVLEILLGSVNHGPTPTIASRDVIASRPNDFLTVVLFFSGGVLNRGPGFSGVSMSACPLLDRVTMINTTLPQSASDHPVSPTNPSNGSSCTLCPLVSSSKYSSMFVLMLDLRNFPQLISSSVAFLATL